jgi:hypothetical protein
VSRAWWLHPPLLAAFPVLFLFATNVREQITLEPLLGPLAIAVAGAAALLVVVVAVFRWLRLEPSRAALVTSVALVLFFSYGHVWQAAGAALGGHGVLLAIWGALAIVGISLAVRARPERVRATTGLLNVAAIVLVGVQLVPIVGLGLQARPAAVDDGGMDGPAAQPTTSDPDIWYLVFDRYGGERGLEAAYGFDNGPFTAELERRGFSVFDLATANYLKTAHSVASTLNMDYLDADALNAAATASDDWTPLYRMLQGPHEVGRRLHDRGYDYLHLGLRRGATYTNSSADRTFIYGDQTEFSAVLLETTIAAALDGLAPSDALGGISELYRSQSLYQLDALRQLASAPAERPRFIFAHILLPHPPYVFNADGSWVTASEAAGRNANVQYIEQLRFTNDQILELVDAIEASADEPPVIVLQSDEGPFPPRYARDEASFAWLEATDAELVQKFSVLAAYRVPGADASELGLARTMTPVNAFRAVFNVLFGDGFDLLPDRNIVFVDGRHLYDLVDVTDRVQEAMQPR